MALVPKDQIASVYETIDGVVSGGLCHRCGVCAGVCPNDAIRFSDSAFPSTTEACNRCGRCVRVCSGTGFPLGRAFARKHGEDFDPGPIGTHLLCASCQASDGAVHRNGASGGLVTQTLLYLMESGRIQGAVVSGRGETPLRPQARIVTSREEILACSGSRYGVFPWGLVLRDLVSAAGGSYAVVGIPCQIRSLHKAFDVVPGLREKVSLIIGLFCGSTIEPDGIRRLLWVNRASPSDLIDVTFRDGPWPGAIRAHAKDGTSQVLFPSHLNEGCQGISYLKSTYGQERCLLCPDHLNVLADISVGDPWNRSDTGHYEESGSDGSTVVLARTEAAVSLIKEMAETGAIKFTKGTVGTLLQKEVQGSSLRRKSALARIARLYRAGRPAPDYGLELPLPEQGLGRLKASMRRVGVTLCRTSPFRDFLIALLFSKPGQWITRINQRRKRKAWQRRS